MRNSLSRVRNYAIETTDIFYHQKKDAKKEAKGTNIAAIAFVEFW